MGNFHSVQTRTRQSCLSSFLMSMSVVHALMKFPIMNDANGLVSAVAVLSVPDLWAVSGLLLFANHLQINSATVGL